MRPRLQGLGELAKLFDPSSAVTGFNAAPAAKLGGTAMQSAMAGWLWS